MNRLSTLLKCFKNQLCVRQVTEFHWAQVATGASCIAQLVKHLPAVWETWVQFLGWKVPLEKEMATHSSILAWRIPWIWQRIVHFTYRCDSQNLSFERFSALGEKTGSFQPKRVYPSICPQPASSKISLCAPVVCHSLAFLSTTQIP